MFPGYNIRLIRRENKMTQKDLAKKIGVTASTITKYEKGSLEPNIETLKKIAVALDVPMRKLIGYDDEFKLTLQKAQDDFYDLEKKISDLDYILESAYCVLTVMGLLPQLCNNTFSSLDVYDLITSEDFSTYTEFLLNKIHAYNEAHNLKEISKEDFDKYTKVMMQLDLRYVELEQLSRIRTALADKIAKLRSSENKSNIGTPIAAHNDHPLTDEEKELMRQDLKDLGDD